jgi:hypothetical protein
LRFYAFFGQLFCSFAYKKTHLMRKSLVFLLSVICTINSQGQAPVSSNWHYRAGLNLNGLRVRTLELSGQALKQGKFIYNLNIGYTYQSPRNGFQTKNQKNIDSLKADTKTSGFFIKPGVQANVFTIANKFTKADMFVGAGITQTWYKRSGELTKLRDTKPLAQKYQFTGVATAPYVSVGANMRLLYSLYFDLGLQYSITNTNSADKLLPSRYDWLPGMGGNFKNANKTSLIAVLRYQFEK